MKSMIRLAHISDIHLTAGKLGWTWRDFFSKRLTSWMNLRLLGRARRFERGLEIVSRLMDDLVQREVDHIVFSGDATALGFESEIRVAAEALRVNDLAIPGLAIPGNHDYCTHSAARARHFERSFAAWQQGRRIDNEPYPFAQPVGTIWLIAVNAATGNRWPWDASGTVGPAQLARLRRLLDELEPGPRILVVHFPVCRADGRREPAHHGLRDLDAVLDVTNKGGVSLWLHGHRHSPYHLQVPTGAAFPALCAGSATQSMIWSYGEYSIDGLSLQGVRRVYDPATADFRDEERFSLTLRP